MQETGTGLSMSGYTHRVHIDCSSRRGLNAKSLGQIYGTFQQRVTVRHSIDRTAAVCCAFQRPYCSIMYFCITVTAGDQSLETAQRETQEELGIDVPVEVGDENLLPILLSHAESHTHQYVA